MYANFDEKNSVLCDEQGIMHSKGDIEALLAECQAHLKHSDLELMALGRMSVEKNHPRMVNQFNFDEYYP